jgi:3-phosphoshikimate 1-carboxyvinyltransferase
LDARLSGAEPVADLQVRASKLRGVVVPRELVALAIDEIPVLCIAAACAQGETVVTGAEELRVKESDRIAAMSAGLAALGVVHNVMPDGMRIEGTPGAAAFGGGVIDSFGDHRIAMSFAVASLRATAAIQVRDVSNVATSFPGFVSLASSIGLSIQ